jgi:hypothetical protein
MVKVWKVLAATSNTISIECSLSNLMAQIPRPSDGIIGGTVTTVRADQTTINLVANEPFNILFGPKTTSFKQIGKHSVCHPRKFWISTLAALSTCTDILTPMAPRIMYAML